VVIPVLRHRILLNFHAESDQVGADEILKQVISQLERPKEN
jgi:MoxR-like ATPase